MKILLINTNPVVSRLTALSARKEGISLDEVDSILEVKNIESYNIVFVDSDINSREVIEFLKKSNVKRRVIFATQDQKNIDSIYNFTILKPFLPSEVSSILRDAKADTDINVDDDLELDSDIFKRVETKEERPTEEEYINLSKLISTKEDKGEKKFSEEKVLETSNVKFGDKLELNSKIDIFSTDKSEESNLDSNLLEPEESKEQKAKVENELFSMDKESDIEVDFNNLDSSEDRKEKEEKKRESEPKVLDRDEISNIKSLLDGAVEESGEDLALNNITVSSSKTEQEREEVKEKREEEKKIETPKVDITRRERVLKDTVGSLPIEELRQLLRGTKIHITIEFPKEV